jgi:dTDP-L-rhamnose 4-epimerase
MRALVTGGAGQIGSHIVDLLIKKGHQVVVLDNLAKPTHLKGRPDWIHPFAEFILGDVRKAEDWEKALPGVDWVFHQAADGGFTGAISYYFTNNSLPTATLFELIRDRFPVKKVITASSQAVYGEGKYACQEHGDCYPSPRPLRQLQGMGDALPAVRRSDGRRPIDESQVDPLTPYALSKYMNEILALRLGRLYGIPSVALRYSLTYGPRQSLFNPYTGIASIFSTRILSSNPPVVYEDGLQRRDFVFVEDVARLTCWRQKTRRLIAGFNVGTGVGTTVLDFVKLLNRLGRRCDRCCEMSSVRDTRHLVTDAGRLRGLGWKPEVSLSDGLNRYAQWIETYGSIEEYFSEAERLLQQSGVVLQAKR